MGDEIDDESWPQKPDGTMDWDAVFEDPERGLIHLINKAQSPEVLHQATAVVIEKLFSRRNDGPNRKKFLEKARGILPEDAPAEDLDALKESISALLLSVRDDRKEKAEAYLAAKEQSEQDGRRTTDKTHFAALRKKIDPVLTVLMRPVVAIPTVLGIVVVGAGLIFIFYAESGPVKGAQRKAALGWVRDYATRTPPIETAKVMSVKITKDKTLHLTYMINDANHAEIFRKMSQELDIDLPPSVCPPKNSGIMNLIGQGYRLAITLQGSEGRLSGGICPY